MNDEAIIRTLLWHAGFPAHDDEVARAVLALPRLRAAVEMVHLARSDQLTSDTP